MTVIKPRESQADQAPAPTIWKEAHPRRGLPPGNRLFLPILLYLLTLVPLQAENQTPLLFLSHLSGNYKEDVYLTVESLRPEVEIRYAFQHGSQWPAWISYREPILLQALVGEERHYRLKISAQTEGELLEVRELDITIDKRKPAPPQINLDETYLPEALVVGFNAASGDRVFYSLEKGVRSHPLLWDGSVLVLAAETETEYHIQAFSEDQAGNQSAISSLSHTLRRAKPELEVLSPAAGSFANPQLLYLRSRDLREIKYTLDGRDPLRNGRPYQGPELLKASGELSLKVVGIPQGRGREILRREVKFRINPEKESSLSSDTESGTYDRSLSIRIKHSLGARLFYTLSERTPTEHDFLLSGLLSISSLPEARKLSVLRLRALSLAGEWQAEYRYFFLMDRKIPPQPLIRIKEPLPLNTAASLVIDNYDQGTVHYTLDGSDPDAGSTAYRRPFTVTDERAANNRLLIKALIVGPSGLSSEIASRELVFDSLLPRPPEIGLSHSGPTKEPVRITARSSEPDVRILYEIGIDDEPPPAISEYSPQAPAVMTLGVPRGLERIFQLRFAAQDPAGNIAERDRVLMVHLDRRPPVCPPLPTPDERGFFDQGFELQLEGESKVFYELADDGSIPRDPTVNSPQYQQGIPLPGVENQATYYHLKLLCQDQVGNLSEVYGAFRYVIDRRRPRLPPISGPENGALYNKDILNLRLAETHTPIFYTLSTDGSEPPDPDTNSRQVSGGSITFRGQDGKETDFWIKLIPYSSNLERAGVPLSLHFTIDRKPPEPPQISGARPEGRYNKSVLLTLRPADSADRIYYSYSTSGLDPPDPLQEGKQYTEPVLFESQPGKEIQVLLRAAARDKAGNRSSVDQRIQFILDHQGPPDPEIKATPGGRLVNRAVTVRFLGEEGRIYYEMTEDGSTPRQPDLQSTLYQTPLFLTGKPDREVTYRIIARGVDALGNTSPGLRVHSFVVDRLAPPAPPDPELTGREGVSAFLISWEHPESYRIYYRVKERTFSPGAFKQYLQPFNVDLDQREQSTAAPMLEFYSEDAAGNKSKERSIALRFLLVGLPKPQFRGIENGGGYNRSRQLQLTAAQGKVRYELSTDGSEPLEVSSSSAPVSGPIRLEAGEGETITFRIRARAFDLQGLNPPSAEIHLSCTIDRTPPDVPFLKGVKANQYYNTDQRFRILSSEGKVFYTLITADQKPPLPPLEQYRPFGYEELLTAEKGGITSYWIAAFSVDGAGNRSRYTPLWNITIDKQSIYVSPQGNDLHQGTRSKPFRTLAQALRYAQSQGPGVIHCAAGVYRLQRSLKINGRVRIRGGFDPDTWQKEDSGQPSSVQPGTHFPPGSTLVEIGPGRIDLEGFEFRDPRQVCSVLIASRGEAVRLMDIGIILSPRSAAVGALLAGGGLVISKSSFSAEPIAPGAALASGPLLVAEQGQLRVEDSVFHGPQQGGDFTVVVLKNPQVNQFTTTEVDPGGGRRRVGILVQNSILNARASRFGSGRGSERSVAVEIRDSQLNLEDCTVAGDVRGNYTVALAGYNGLISAVKSRIRATARYGATGISLRQGEIRLIRSRVSGDPTAEFLYLVEIRSGRGYLANSILDAAPSGDSVCALMADAETDWYNNTIIGARGGNLTVGFMLEGRQSMRLINNILQRQGEARGTAVFYSSPEPRGLLMMANNLGGWQSLFQLDSGLRYRPAQIEELNQQDGDPFGGPFHGNIVEDFAGIFTSETDGEYRLRPTSASVNAGIDLRNPSYRGPEDDFEGQKRPAPSIGAMAAYDIGADELY